MAATPKHTFDPCVWRDNGPERERRKETCSVGRGQRGWGARAGSGGEDGGERRSGKAALRLRSEHLARALRARRFRNYRDLKSHAVSRVLPCAVPWVCSSSLLSSSECGWLLPLVTVLARLLDRTPAPERSITEGMAATNTRTTCSL